MNNIEKFKNRKNEIEDSLKELKNNISYTEEEKKEKAQEIKNQAEELEQEIKKEIDFLKNKTDVDSRKKQEEAEALLNSFTEIMTLYDSIINPSNNTKTPKWQPENKNENVFWNVWNWIWKQWNNVWNGDKWTLDAEWWKNLLRAVWFAVTWAWAIALIWKWAKELWNWVKESRWERWLVTLFKHLDKKSKS